MRVLGSVIGMIGLLSIAIALTIPFITFVPDAGSSHLVAVIFLILGVYDLWVWQLAGRGVTDRNLNHVCGSLAVNGYSLLCLFWGHPWMQAYGIVPLAILLIGSRALYAFLAKRFDLKAEATTGGASGD